LSDDILTPRKLAVLPLNFSRMNELATNLFPAAGKELKPRIQTKKLV
jgi:hypothetical protein